MNLDQEKTLMRTYLGDLVDSDEFAHLFAVHTPIDKKSVTPRTHLHKCVLLTKRYPAMNDYLEEYLKTCNDINKQDCKNVSALHLACGYSDVCSTNKTIEILINAGINVNLQDDSGDTALHYILAVNVGDSGHCDKNTKQIIKMLIEAHTDLNLQDKDGDTAMKTIERFTSLYYKQKMLDLVAQNAGKMTKRAIK